MVNNLISIVNNTVVQATIPAISKFTAEDDRRAEAVKRAGLRMQLVLGGTLALIFFLGAPLLARFEKAPDYVGYFRVAAAIPFLYALYALFVGSANGLRRFRTQASFDVGFSTVKTILLLGLAVVWKVSGAFVGFAAAAVVILGCQRSTAAQVCDRQADGCEALEAAVVRHETIDAEDQRDAGDGESLAESRRASPRAR